MTPEQEADVRRALAALVHRDADPAVPPHVARRLDDVLADLVADRRGAPGAPGGSGAADHPDDPRDSADPVSRLDDHRPPRRWRHRLVAAAAVAVIALAGAAVATHGFSGSGQAESSASRSRASSGPATSTAPTSGRTPSGTSRVPHSSSALAGLPQLRSADLRAGVAAALASTGGGSASARAPSDGSPQALPSSAGSARLPQPDTGRRSGPAGCPEPSVGTDERLLAVLLDGRPATLVVGPVVDGTRRASVYSCSRPPAVLARTSVPVG